MREAHEAHTEHAAGWTPERTQELKKLWGHHSCSEIAAIMGGGLTRNGVIGKATRLKLPRREPSVSLKAKRAPNPLRKVNNEHGGMAFKIGKARQAGLHGAEAMAAVFGRPEPVVGLGDAFPASGALVRLEDLGRDDCRWPFGDPLTPDFGFCGKHVAEGEVYCRGHCQKAYLGWQS